MAEIGLELPEIEDFETEELIRFKGYDNAFRAYNKCFEIYENFIPCLYKEIRKKVMLPALNPAEINLLFEGTRLSSRINNYSSITGLFFSILIQDSYEKGNNLFFLNAEYLKKKIDFLGYELKGKETPLKLRVKGNAGHSFADEAENILAKAEECGDWSGKFAKKTKLFVKKAGAYALWHASDSVLIADFVGIDAGKGARNCEFRTKEQKTLEKLLNSVPIGKGNKIILISGNGSYSVVRNE